MSGIQDIDTPALLVDQDVLLRNLHGMQEKARKAKVSLRPHTKTHRTPAIALMQIEAGAKGIAVAKVGEAEVMAENGLDDILIANEIFGRHEDGTSQSPCCQDQGDGRCGQQGAGPCVVRGI